MKQCYETYNLRAKSLETIAQAEAIIEEYNAEGYTLTLRQLYYQFVAKDLLPNTKQSYDNLGKLITKARMSGLISWTDIQDKGRSCRTYFFEENISTIFDGMEGFITYDMWKRQDYYVEAWIEKDALSDVLSRPCNKYQVPYMACKGYMSSSAAWGAGQRFLRAHHEGKECILLHLGDHDPSGLHMTEDNNTRLDMFSESPVDVRRLALNMDQIQEYAPPPNAAKMTDPRAPEYIKVHGEASWELDALKPQIIAKLVEDAIRPLIDFDIWDAAKKEQNEQRKILGKLPNHVDEILDFVRDRELDGEGYDEDEDEDDYEF